MHPNEVDFRIPKLGGEDTLIEHVVKLSTYEVMAANLGEKYLEALRIQMARQESYV